MTEPFWDPSEVEDVARGILPAGDYRVMISKVEYRATKSGTGSFMAVTYEVLEPDVFRKRYIFGNFNIVNTNEQAQKIGMSQFKDLMFASGITDAVATASEVINRLTNKIIWVKVGIKKDNRDGSDQNSVLRWSKDIAGLDGTKPRKTEAKKEEYISGVFGDKIPLPSDADVVDKLF